MVMVPLGSDLVCRMVTLPSQSDLDHPGKTRHLEGEGLEKWYTWTVGDMGLEKEHGCILRLGSHWGSDMLPLATCSCLLGDRK